MDLIGLKVREAFLDAGIVVNESPDMLQKVAATREQLVRLLEVHPRFVRDCVARDRITFCEFQSRRVGDRSSQPELGWS